MMEPAGFQGRSDNSMSERRILTRFQLNGFAIAMALANRFPGLPLSVELRKDPMMDIPKLVRPAQRTLRPGVVRAKDHRAQREWETNTPQVWMRKF
jgi:hypothetical protein